MYIDEAHMALDVFRFAVFFIYIFTLFRLFIKYNYDLFYLIFFIFDLTYEIKQSVTGYTTNKQTNGKQYLNSCFTAQN